MLVAAPTNSRDLAIHACEFNKHNYHGRTIAVASVDKTKHHVSGSSLLNHLKLYM